MTEPAYLLAVRTRYRLMIAARACFREIIDRLCLVLGGTMFLLALGAAYRASASAQGAPLWIPLAMIPLMVGHTLPYFLPVALMTAVGLTYGRMAAEGEEVALLASGISPVRLLAPAWASGLLAALVSFPLLSAVLPDLYSQTKDLLHRTRFAALENPDPGSSELRYQGLYLAWQERDTRGGFRDVVLSFEDEESSEQLIVRAARAAIKITGTDLLIAFEGMRTSTASVEGDSWDFQSDGTATLKVNLASLAGSSFNRNPRSKDFSSNEILARLDSGAVPENEKVKYLFTYHQRFSLAFACLPLALLGAFLGRRLGQGGISKLIATVLLFLLLCFYPLVWLGEGLAIGGSLSPFMGAWLPVVFSLGVIGGLKLVGRRR